MESLSTPKNISSSNLQVMKNIAILGSTGSIGKQALEVIENHKDKYAVEVLTAFNNYELLIEQA